MQIIKRSLNLEVFATILLVTLILLVILLSSNMAKYLALAVTGKVQLWTVFSLIGLKLPLHLTMLLPLSMLLGVLLVLGRMAQDRELVVWLASGLGYKDFYKILINLGLVLSLGLAVISLYIFPVAHLKSTQLQRSIGSGVALENLTAGKFHELSGGNRVIYAADIDKETKVMQDVFLQIREAKRQHMLRAKQGVVEIDEAGNSVLVLYEGTRYSAPINSLEYTIVSYQKHALLLEKNSQLQSKLGIGSQPTKTLFSQLNNRYAQAELQWRLSIPIMGILMIILGVALSKYSPRTSKYGKLLPGVLIYFSYINMVILLKNKIIDGSWNPWLGMWPVHLVYASLIAWLVWKTLRPLRR